MNDYDHDCRLDGAWLVQALVFGFSGFLVGLVIGALLVLHFLE